MVLVAVRVESSRAEAIRDEAAQRVKLLIDEMRKNA
jgi:hypothetical protein